MAKTTCYTPQLSSEIVSRLYFKATYCSKNPTSVGEVDGVAVQ